MVRVWVILGVAVVVFTVYAIVDCALLDRTRIRGLARGWWILIILFVPVIGGLLWFIIGRGSAARVGRGGRRTVAPDDDMEFLRRLDSDVEHEERIRRLEQELAELDSDDNNPLGTDRRRPDGPETPGESGGPSGRPNA